MEFVEEAPAEAEPAAPASGYRSTKPLAKLKANRDEDVQFSGSLRAQQQFNTAEYDAFEENPFLAAATNPLSTFGVDIDTASYSNVRRFINRGSLPPRDAVRVEEMINYFTYDYPQPTGDDPFSINLEVAGCPWQPGSLSPPPEEARWKAFLGTSWRRARPRRGR